MAPSSHLIPRVVFDIGFRNSCFELAHWIVCNRFCREGQQAAEIVWVFRDYLGGESDKFDTFC